MSLPYMVKVTSDKNDINVKVHPQPVATKDEYLPVVAKSFQNVIVNYGNKSNTIMNRTKLRNELIALLEDFHKQGMIKPKEDEHEEE